MLLDETKESAIKLMHKNLLADHVAILVEKEDSGLQFMLQNGELQQLALIYRLFKFVEEGHHFLQLGITEHIVKKGVEINENYDLAKIDHKARAVKPLQWVEDVLSLKRKFDKIMDQSFDNDLRFINSVGSAMQEVVNSLPQCCDYVSIYADNALKIAAKGKLDDEFEVYSENCLDVFRYIRDKDVFERYYKNHLAKRLLYMKNANEEPERLLLSKFKVFLFDFR
jgi:cullin 3